MAVPQQKPDDDMGVRQDLVAAAALGPCKAIHRQMLLSPSKEGDWWDCLTGYSAEVLMKWGSRDTYDGYTYYYERGSGRAQWERPQVLSRAMEEGIALAKSGADYSPDRPWETCEMLDIAHIMCLQRRGARCESTRNAVYACLKKKAPP
eukprot:Hpha_TRINITY_DN16150_c1_g5::TRINITY_DN16150_c1_g5_i1::g.3594::m.3594